MDSARARRAGTRSGFERLRGLPARTERSPARTRPRARVLEQLTIAFAPVTPRWRFSRPALASPHHARILARLEFVRGFFPELDGITVRVGLVRKPGVLGWGSLDPDQPGVWVRPRRLDAFTIAHELTHLLQARGLVPRGERACDLWALARSPLVVDAAPGYLKVPEAMHRQQALDAGDAALLHRAACRALAARAAGDRRYLRRFELEVAAASHERRPAGLGGAPGRVVRALADVFAFARPPRA